MKHSLPLTAFLPSRQKRLWLVVHDPLSPRRHDVSGDGECVVAGDGRSDELMMLAETQDAELLCQHSCELRSPYWAPQMWIALSSTAPVSGEVSQVSVCNDPHYTC